MSDTTFGYFTYYPIHGAPEVAAIVFATAAIILNLQIMNTNTVRWFYILVGTAIAEFAGYIFRIICISHATLGLFVCMNLCLLLPPNALALFNYKVLGEIARKSNVANSRVYLRPKFIVWFFFASDIFSFLLQSTGAGMTISEDTAKNGRWICIGGLAIQMVFLTSFIILVTIVMRDPRYVLLEGDKDGINKGSKKHVLWTVHATTALIYIRSVYRLIEFIDGYGGKIYSAEWAFYVFDTIMILLAFGVYIFVFLGTYFPKHSVNRIDLYELQRAEEAWADRDQTY
ncbi:hypothetical protein LPJ57_011526 [Coemansia sp. RSA 486]|nr:hypothetical protein LPJ57_011526 [Coemansia sp. RSA 486]KAJ2596647.1 hypothetical protein GGF39_003355 [Coemansia sp. RSA 1721]KAJ2634717.1 hypothetical protein GGF40_004029 [Coemansia sp. RSA 1286]